MNDIDNWMTVEEAASLSERSNSTIHHLIKTKKISSIKRGRFSYVKIEEVMQYIVPKGKKKCRQCKEIKDEKEFPDKRRWCEECWSIKLKDKNLSYYHKNKNNPEYLRMRKRHSAKTKFNISEEEYFLMMQNYDTLCDICHQKTEQPHIDHDHKTGIVRGILCHKCNSGIGLLNEDINILASAIIYLNRLKDYLLEVKNDEEI